MTLKTRVKALEKAAPSPKKSGAQVVIYQPGEPPKNSEPGKVTIYLPDNGRKDGKQ